jgi:hypothetical protein
MRILLRIGTRMLSCVCLVLTLAFGVLAQQATVARDVNLRSDPSTTNPRIELLKPGSSVTLLDLTPQGGFYHVKAADGQQGWVWSKNITLGTALVAIVPTSTECDDSLWDHVYNPQRLIVKEQCVAITGTIVDATNKKEADGVRHEADGDTHGWLSLDPQFKTMLNAKAACPSTFHNPVEIPPVGSHVRVIGTYVQDTNHAQWMEIHPVTSITVIQ